MLVTEFLGAAAKAPRLGSNARPLTLYDLLITMAQ
jgi:hypothetical protein